MYRKDNPHQMKFQNFHLPFGGELCGENRWVILAQQIPWQQIEQDYSELFSEDEGCPAKHAQSGKGFHFRIRPEDHTEMGPVNSGCTSDGDEKGRAVEPLLE